MFVPEMEVQTIADPFMNEQDQWRAVSAAFRHHQRTQMTSGTGPKSGSSSSISARRPLPVHMGRAAPRRQGSIFCEEAIDYDLERRFAASNAQPGSRRKLRRFPAATSKPQPPAGYDMVRDNPKVSKSTLIKDLLPRSRAASGIPMSQFQRLLRYMMITTSIWLPPRGQRLPPVNAVEHPFWSVEHGEAGDVRYRAVLPRTIPNSAISVIETTNNHQAVGYVAR